MIEPTDEPVACDDAPNLQGSGTAVATPARPRFVICDPYGLRALVLGWCMWLLISWSITLAIGATAHAVRWVVFCALVGLMGVWPALRLSQQLPGEHGKDEGGRSTYDPALATEKVMATWLDWVCLMLVFQVVIWPLMIVGRWTFEQTLWLNVAVMSWSALTGLCIGLGRIIPIPGGRSLAMMLGMLLVVAEPVVMMFLGHNPAAMLLGQGDPDTAMHVSPIQAVWELTTTIQPSDPSPWVPVILSIALAALLGWVMLWWIARYAIAGAKRG